MLDDPLDGNRDRGRLNERCLERRSSVEYMEGAIRSGERGARDIIDALA
jgi:hypothetical protein